MEFTCYRDHEFASEKRFLPAPIYNLAMTLLARASAEHLFVPIRSMQYLAIVEHDEIVFIDGERKCWIDLAWRNFQPQLRHSLQESVQYEAVYYRLEAIDLMRRLQPEFPLALRQLEIKNKPASEARVLQFPRARSGRN